MRITSSQVLQTNVLRLNRALQQVFTAQEQISSGRRVNRPSDDPTAIHSSIQIRATRSHLEQIRSNAALTTAQLRELDDGLQDYSTLLIRAQELGIAALNGGLNDTDRESIALEVDGLLDQAISLGNRRGGGGYLFAGSQRSQEPFAVAVPGSPSGVVYNGDEGSSPVDLGNSLQVSAGLPGSRLIESGPRGTTVYTGNTGAAAGSGSDGIVGSAQLLVSHTRTVLGGGGFNGDGDPTSQLQLGASSAAGDTLLGAHTITLVDVSGTGASGTISIDGGAPITWSAADTDRAVTNDDGDTVYLDFSAINPGFNGTVSLQADGNVSLDGGLTQVPIDFAAANQRVVDSRNGESIFVNSTAVTRVGAENLHASGTFDVFATLAELRDQLRNRDGLSSDQQTERIQLSLAELERNQDHVLNLLADVGSRSNTVAMAENQSVQLDLTFAQRQAELEDVDLAKVTTELAQAETLLQAALALSTRIGQLPSLLGQI